MAFPAYAGMFLRSFLPLAGLVRFPRVCGDVSVKRYKITGVKGLSPRMRGCFSREDSPRRAKPAFPAYAGMFPMSERSNSLSK